MPKAQVSQETVRCELKTAPPDGYITLRRMPYGQKLARTQMSSKLSFSGTQKKGGDADIMGEVAAINKEATLYDFSHCIVEHNLEKDDGTLFNFKDPADVDLLDPRIGDEINAHINETLNFEGELGNSTNGSGTA